MRICNVVTNVSSTSQAKSQNLENSKRAAVFRKGPSRGTMKVPERGKLEND